LSLIEEELVFSNVTPETPVINPPQNLFFLLYVTKTGFPEVPAKTAGALIESVYFFGIYGIIDLLMASMN
jgi:hypothetical protein